MIIIVMVIIIGVGLLFSYSNSLNIEKPVTHSAKVITKEYWGGENRGAFAGGRLFVRAAPACLVTFELENSKSVTLLLPEKIYDKLSEGSTGMLQYTSGNKKFKDFLINDAMNNCDR